MTTIKETMQKLREDGAEARAERCWPGNEMKKMEARCDFREGFDLCLSKLQRVVEIQEKALGEIENVHSAFVDKNRNASYKDYELRMIAKNALYESNKIMETTKDMK